MDPAYLYFNEKEFNTIFKDKDFRSDFAQKLEVSTANFYLKPNGTLMDYPSQSSMKLRSLEDISLSLAELLYHELSHAVDINFNAQEQGSNLKTKLSTLLIKQGLNLERQMPKHAYLQYLANTSYHGTTYNFNQSTPSRTEIGEMFDESLAVSLYSFSSVHEDISMTFEEFMMKWRFRVDSLVVFYEIKSSSTQGQSKIFWGQFNPAFNDNMMHKTKFIAKNILPHLADEIEQITSKAKEIYDPELTFWQNVELKQRR